MKSLVFVSSAIEEFREERKVAKAVIGSYPFLEAWIFEEEGASAGPLEGSYLDKVRICSIFVLLLGREVTAPVRNEFLEAKAHGRRTLVLLKRSSDVPDEVNRILSEADAKYGAFEGVPDFERALRLALDNEIGRALNEPPERRSFRRKETLLRELLAGGKPVRITPVFPQAHNEALYDLREVGTEEVIVQKRSSGHQIPLPVDKITVLTGVGSDSARLQLDGRLQLLSALRQWKFFPDYATDGYGIPKPGCPSGAEVERFRARLQQAAITSQWNAAHEAMYGQWSIVYDDDGRYFRCEGRMHRGSVEILVGQGQ